MLRCIMTTSLFLIFRVTRVYLCSGLVARFLLRTNVGFRCCLAEAGYGGVDGYGAAPSARVNVALADAGS
ncbi:hypothetical protein B0G75_10127 [Paraburkholderia sp. BL18I3N2]|nr:hypothetical protein B0G75_10127 [Paraburkholderia sp. BL18I3N2]